MRMSRKGNVVYQYNHHDDHKVLHNLRSETFLKLYQHDAPNHYPLAGQISRRYKQTQAGIREKNKHDLKIEETSNKKFMQSKQTQTIFIDGEINKNPIIIFIKK